MKKRAIYHQNKATKSKEKQKELLSRQKLQGLKIKERNRK